MERARAAWVLGVDVSAGEREIHDAFRRRAREVHPDHTGGDLAAMVELNAAYATLMKGSGQGWHFVRTTPDDSWSAETDDREDDWSTDSISTIGGPRSPLRLFAISLAVVATVMTTIVFIAAVGYDWSVSP